MRLLVALLLLAGCGGSVEPQAADAPPESAFVYLSGACHDVSLDGCVATAPDAMRCEVPLPPSSGGNAMARVTTIRGALYTGDVTVRVEAVTVKVQRAESRCDGVWGWR